MYLCVTGTKWNTKILRWRVTGYSSQLSHKDLIDVLTAAFDTWAAVTNLYFEHTSGDNFDIEVTSLC